MVWLVLGLSFTTGALSADNANSTQQALEQLRILQKRMSPTNEAGKEATGGGESDTGGMA